MDSGLWIIVLEAAVALALLAFIVWWTVPKRRDTESDKRSKER
jgi:cyanate permease